MARRDSARAKGARAGAAPPPAAVQRGPATSRVATVDSLRGFALLLMIAYHASFDLRWYRVIAADFEHDMFWLGARAFILSSFLLLAGVSLVLADRAGQSLGAFWRHVGQIAVCALIVSVASYVLFPRTFIWFGVLHAIAVSLVIGYPLRRSPRLASVIGVVVIAAGLLLSSSWFDHRPRGWLGFMSAKPATEDYVPLFPWTGVLLLGIPVGHWLARRAFAPIAFAARLPGTFAFAGRHSLAIYMVHQPVLLGVLALLVRQ